MSLPPPPGSFGSVPPNGGGGPSWGGQPQQPGQPYGEPYQGHPGGQWGPPQQWAGGPPPNKGGKGKWILIGLALVAVIAVSIVGTVLVLRPDSGGGNGSTPSAQNGNSEFASANDTGPANIVTEDPTCEAWGRIARDFADTANSVGWADRDPKVPAKDWTPEQRNTYETVSRELTEAVGLAPNLEKQTPHRVMRELYGQFVAYTQALIDAIPTYEYRHNPLANVSGATMSALSAVCAAVDYRSIQALAPLVPESAPPTTPASITDQAGEKSINATMSICQDWISKAQQFDKDTAAWMSIDANIPASAWSPEQKAVYDAVPTVMTARADELEKLGRDSGNPAFEDFAVLAAQYLRAYVIAIPKYTSADNYVSDVSRYLVSSLLWACRVDE